MTLPKKTLAVLTTAALAGFYGQTTQAAGFALLEHSAAGLGNAYSGDTVRAQDASTVWFNPAAITRLPGRQISASGHIVSLEAQLNNRGSTLNPAFGAADISGADSADVSELSVLPAFFYSRPLKDNLYFGFGINVPFGLGTEYDRDWFGRYQAIESAIATININPNLAWNLNDKLSIGVGINAQFIEATLSNAIDSGAVCLGLASRIGPEAQSTCLSNRLTSGVQANDSFGEVEGDDWSFGYNFGLHYLLNDKTTLGLAYRSEISHTLTGSGSFSVNAALQSFLNAQGTTLLSNSGVSADATMPQMLSLSASHQVKPKLKVYGDISWTGWNSLQELRIKYDNPQQPDTVTKLKWDNSFRYSIGMDYVYSPTWTLRAGLSMDETPITSPLNRTPRIPGEDRKWLAFGATYQWREDLTLDMGYAYLFVDEPVIDHTSESPGDTVRADASSDLNLFGASLNWSF